MAAARVQGHQLQHVSTVERQIDDAALVHYLNQVSGGGLHQRCIGIHGDLLAGGSRQQDHVHLNVGIYLQGDAGL